MEKREIFNISLLIGVKLHIHLFRFFFFFFFFSLSSANLTCQVRISRNISESPFDFDTTRLDCMLIRGCFSYIRVFFLSTGLLYSFGFLYMVDYSISSLRTFYICRGRRFVTIPANVKKNKKTYNKLCYKQINVYFIFMSIKKFRKAYKKQTLKNHIVFLFYLLH